MRNVSPCKLVSAARFPSILSRGASLGGTLFGRSVMGAAVLSVAVLAGVARGQSYEVLHAFSADTGGPQANLLQTPDGKLYGTTSHGGFSGQGSVFVLTPSGSGGFTYATLHEFHGDDGRLPIAALIEADGSFYGTTYVGGANDKGTVFKMDSAGHVTTLHSFAGGDGANPNAALIQASDGLFYGTTLLGGTNDVGTVFRMDASGNLTTLHSFVGSPADGAYCYAPLVEGPDGSLYGTTGLGGRGYGTVFKVERNSGSATMLHDFDYPSEGYYPRAGLVLAAGSFYGTTNSIAFRMDPSGASFTILHTFGGTDGLYDPTVGLLRAAEGNFYGITAASFFNNNGAVYRMDGTGSVTPIYFFSGGDGISPSAPLIQGIDGTLYGTTLAGGPGGNGTVFAMDASGPSGLLTTLYSFAGGGPTGPNALIQAGDGNFFATAIGGGRGTAFRMDMDGNVTPLHNFVGGADGAIPHSALVEGADGNFYGTTVYGGPGDEGTAFRMDPSGNVTTLHAFFYLTGRYPYAGLVQASDGSFYGTTREGGGGFHGNVFKMDASGNVAPLHSFIVSDGASPYASLIEADGGFYGTTREGGSQNRGTVFRMDAGGTVTTLHSFVDVEGGAPQAGLVQGADGSFYGTASFGGVGLCGCGTVFKVDGTGTLTTLHVFDGFDGKDPSSALVLASDGNFYGTTSEGGASNNGTVFQMDPSGNVTTIHHFTGSDGTYPVSTLLQGADGKLYGTTSGGGPGNGGVIFRLTVPACLPPVAGGLSPICAGQTLQLTASTVAGATYSWAGPNGFSSSLQNPSISDATPEASGVYSVTATVGSCTSSAATTTVTVRPSPTAVASGSASICSGSSTPLSGSGGVSCSWSPATGLSSASSCAPTASPSVTTTYTLTVTDANWCVSTNDATVIVTVNPHPTAFASGSATILAGSSTPLTGSGGASCSWSPATGLSSAGSCSPTASPSVTTTYTLTVTDANGCVSTNNPSVTVTVLALTATTMTSSANPSSFGQSVTFKATVTAGSGTPTGTVTFMDGATALGIGTLSLGSASFTTSSLGGGSHSITAVYGGEGTFAGSSSASLSQTVERAQVNVAVVSSVNPSSYGQVVTFTAGVSWISGVPTGFVTFRDGVIVMGDRTLDASGQATLTVGGLSVGSHAITVAYSGDTNFSPHRSPALTQRVTNASACGTLRGPLSLSLSAGTDPQGVAVGDLNGDGKADLVSANFSSSSVSVFMGNGDGTFHAKADYVVGLHPLSVAVGDFDGDGSLDLAVANAASGNVSVLLNAGNGTFQPAHNFGAGSSPQSVVVADFNGDGKLDLVVSNSSSANVSVLLGNGDGTFQAAVNSPAGTQPSGVAVGDFNEDGLVDVAVGNYTTSQISVLLGKGDGTFQAPVTYATGPNPVSVAVGDFDGNGKLDLAVASFGATSVSVLLGNGNGTFKASVNYGVGSKPVSVVVGDFNGDGISDLATGNSNSDNVSILLGKGNGTFQTAANYPAGNQPHAVAVGDFYGNGKPGLVVANELTNDLSVLFGSCPTTTTVTSSDTSSDFGQSVTFTARVAPASGTPTGTVTFKDGTTVLGTGTLASGSASLSTSLLCPGTHKITAVYSGDSNFKDGTSAVLTQTVQSLAIVAPAAVCPGSTGNSASVPDLGPGATYAWTITNGTITGGAGTPAITWKAGTANPVTLKLTVKTAAGCTASDTATVTNTAPSAIITAPASVCAASTGNSASVPSAGTGVTYAWTIANGTITSGTGTNAIKFTATAPGAVTLGVTVTNATGCSVNGAKSVTVKAIPDGTITAPLEVCHNSIGNQASVLSAGSGALYSWTITNGTITAGAGTNAITFSAKASGSVILKVTVTNANGCASTSSRTIAIKTSC